MWGVHLPRPFPIPHHFQHYLVRPARAQTVKMKCFRPRRRCPLVPRTPSITSHIFLDARNSRGRNYCMTHLHLLPLLPLSPLLLSEGVWLRSALVLSLGLPPQLGDYRPRRSDFSLARTSSGWSGLPGRSRLTERYRCRRYMFPRR